MRLISGFAEKIVDFCVQHFVTRVIKKSTIPDSTIERNDIQYIFFMRWKLLMLLVKNQTDLPVSCKNESFTFLESTKFMATKLKEP